MFIGTQQRLKWLQEIVDGWYMYIDNNEIKRVQSCKYLGVWPKLLWKNEVKHDFVKKQTCIYIYILKRLRPYLDES